MIPSLWKQTRKLYLHFILYFSLKTLALNMPKSPKVSFMLRHKRNKLIPILLSGYPSFTRVRIVILRHLINCGVQPLHLPIFTMLRLKLYLIQAEAIWLDISRLYFVTFLNQYLPILITVVSEETLAFGGVNYPTFFFFKTLLDIFYFFPNRIKHLKRVLCLDIFHMLLLYPSSLHERTMNFIHLSQLETPLDFSFLFNWRNYSGYRSVVHYSYLNLSK